MADRLVQQHTRPARPHHHRHAASRRRDGVEVDGSLAHRLAGIGHGPFLGLEEAIIGAPAAAKAAALTAAVMLDDDADIEPYQRPDVPCPGTVAGGDQHGVMYTAKTDRDLGNARIEAAGVGVQPLQQRHLVSLGHHIQRIVRRIQGGVVTALPGLHRAALPAAGDRAGRAGSLGQGSQAQVVAIGEAGLLTGLGAHADPLIDIETAVLDDTVFQHPGLTDLVLEIQVRRIHPRGRHQLPQHAGEAVGAQFGGQQQATFDLAQQIAHIVSLEAGTMVSTGSKRRCPATGMRPRMVLRCCKSIVPVTTPSPCGRQAVMSPQGSIRQL